MVIIMQQSTQILKVRILLKQNMSDIYLNTPENTMNIHDYSYALQPFGSQGNLDLFSVYSSQL